MSQLVVRNLEPDLVESLKARAAAANISAEEQHRRILREALTMPKKLSFEQVLMLMPNVGRDEDFARIQDTEMRPDPFDDEWNAMLLAPNERKE
jgi:antitoxin FitA